MSITLRLSSLMCTLAVTAVIAAPAGAAPANIVFSDGGDLYARNLDGGKRPLTPGRPFDGFPAWSPDGGRIAYQQASRWKGLSLRRRTVGSPATERAAAMPSLPRREAIDAALASRNKIGSEGECVACGRREDTSLLQTWWCARHVGSTPASRP